MNERTTTSVIERPIPCDAAPQCELTYAGHRMHTGNGAVTLWKAPDGTEYMHLSQLTYGKWFRVEKRV